MVCPFADNYKNQEGWLIMPDGKLVCADWDEFCVECRVDSSNDFIFGIASNCKEQSTEAKKE